MVSPKFLSSLFFFLSPTTHFFFLIACNFKQNHCLWSLTSLQPRIPWPALLFKLWAATTQTPNHSSPLRPDHVASEGSLALEWQCRQARTLIVFTVNYSFLTPMVHPALTTPVLPCGQTHLLLPLFQKHSKPGQPRSNHGQAEHQLELPLVFSLLNSPT